MFLNPVSGFLIICLISLMGLIKDSISVLLPPAFIISFFIFHLFSNCSLCIALVSQDLFKPLTISYSAVTPFFFV